MGGRGGGGAGEGEGRLWYCIKFAFIGSTVYVEWGRKEEEVVVIGRKEGRQRLLQDRRGMESGR